MGTCVCETLMTGLSLDSRVHTTDASLQEQSVPRGLGSGSSSVSSHCSTSSAGWRSTKSTAKQSVYEDLASYTDKVELHKGRHSTVWSGTCKKTGQTVVIKAYNKSTLKSRQLLNVQREINLLQFFKHAGCNGVVHMLTSFEDSKTVYLVFEACMRGDLYQMLVKHKHTLKEEYVATKVLVPLLSVLHQLHALHIIHRDIKPENIFITKDGNIALGDFGLAAHKFQDKLTERVGTLDYMAPEVLSMAPIDEPATSPITPVSPTSPLSPSSMPRTYDEKIDVWAVGVLVYELLAGRPPFEVEDAKETAKLILQGTVNNFPAHITAQAQDFIRQALTMAPAERPSAHRLLEHPWITRYFGGNVPSMPAESGPGMTMAVLRNWVTSSWSKVGRLSGFKCPGLALKPHSTKPLRLPLSPSGSPRKALSSDDPFLVAAATEAPSDPYLRKSLPGNALLDSDGPDSPLSCRGFRRCETYAPHSDWNPDSALNDDLNFECSWNTGNVTSRESSAGSLDMVPVGLRTLSNASSIGVVPRSSSATELDAEREDLGLAPRSISVMARPEPQLWQTPAVQMKAKPAGKSRFCNS